MFIGSRGRSSFKNQPKEDLLLRLEESIDIAMLTCLATEEAVIWSATDYPAYGQVRTSNELRKQGVFVSPSGVRSIWLRHNLEDFKLRLKALETKVAEDGGLVLTEAQV